MSVSFLCSLQVFKSKSQAANDFNFDVYLFYILFFPVVIIAKYRVYFIYSYSYSFSLKVTKYCNDKSQVTNASASDLFLFFYCFCSYKTRIPRRFLGLKTGSGIFFEFFLLWIESRRRFPFSVYIRHKIFCLHKEVMEGGREQGRREIKMEKLNRNTKETGGKCERETTKMGDKEGRKKKRMGDKYDR